MANHPNRRPFVTLTSRDIGQPTIYAFGQQWPVSDFMGHVGAYDVGKRVYKVGGILQVENDEQLARRLSQAQKE